MLLDCLSAKAPEFMTAVLFKFGGLVQPLVRLLNNNILLVSAPLCSAGAHHQLSHPLFVVFPLLMFVLVVFTF